MATNKKASTTAAEFIATCSPQEGAEEFRSEINPTGMFSRIELITPERAKALLEGTEYLQRFPRGGRIDLYSTERKNNRWTLHHQGIGIDVNGIMRDGQHRMKMVVKTGLPTAFMVTYNIPCESLLHVDEQLTRTDSDSIRMARQGNYTDSIISTLRGFLNFPNNSSSNTKGKEGLVEDLRKWAEPLEFAEELLYKQLKISKGPRALVARAYLHLKDAKLIRLKQFCYVIKTGDHVSQDWRDDSAGLKYREFLFAYQKVGYTAEREKYVKAGEALLQFLNRQLNISPILLKPDLYPLPVIKPLEVDASCQE